MSTLTDALQAVIDAKYNAVNLADPDLAQADAEMAFKQAVVAAIENLSGDKVDASANAPQPDMAALEAQEAELSAKVAAGQAALQALEATLHPADAAPSSSEPPTIAPSTPS